MKSDEESIKDVIALWHRRTAEGDVAAVLTLMTEDAMFLVAGNPPMNGKASFEQGLRGVLAQNKIRSTAHVDEVVVSGDLAFARTQLSVELLPNDGSVPQKREGPTLSIFCRSSNGSWLLKRDANLLSNSGA